MTDFSSICEYEYGGEKKDNFCFAAVREFKPSPNRKCIIRQCHESNRDVNGVLMRPDGLGKIHGNMVDKGVNVEMYKEVSEQFNQEAVYLPRDEQWFVETNLSDIYLGLNEYCRKRLSEFIQRYRELVDSLLKQYEDLKKRHNDAMGIYDMVFKSFEAKQREFEQSEGRQAAEYQAEIARLQAELQEAQNRKDQIKKELDSCTWNIQDITHHADTKLMQLYRDPKYQLPSDEDILLRQREEIARMQAVIAKQTSAEIVKTGGLYTLIKIKCDELKDNIFKYGRLTYGPYVGENYVAVENENENYMFHSVENADAKINFYSDNLHPKTCNSVDQAKLKAMKPIYDTYINEIKKIEEIILQNFANKATNIVNLKPIANFEHLKSIQYAKAAIDAEIETPSHREYIRELEQKHNSSFEKYMKYLNMLFESAKKLESKNMAPVSNEFKNNVKNVIKEYEDLDSDVYRNILNSGEEFTNMSLLSFMEKQNPDNLFDAITIVALGGTGSGKTTAAKAILRNIFLTYRAFYHEYLKKVDIRVFEVSLDEKGSGFDLHILESNTDRPQDKLSKPFILEQHYRNSDLTKSENLCFRQEKKTREMGMEDCQVQTRVDPLTGARIKTKEPLLPMSENNVNDTNEPMLKLMSIDRATEMNRQTKYTFFNQNGSSRSFKIINLTFQNSKNVKKTVNLIDCPGYEDYEGMELTNFYQNLMTEASILDRTVKKEEINDRAKEYGNRILEEGKWIRSQLEKLEHDLMRYKILQKGGHAAYQRLAQEKVSPPKDSKGIAERQMELDQTGWIEALRKIPGDNKLDLFPEHSAVIVVAGFKAVIDDTEKPAVKQTIHMLNQMQKV